jgi:glycerophosphoryl diester phosphodiesterase
MKQSRVSLVLLCICIIWFILRYFEGRKGHEQPHCRRPLVCSHKAGGSKYPEGSLEGVAALIAEGIKCFDVDVCTSTDGSLFVGHPGYLRTTLGIDEKRDVSEFTWAELLDRAKKRETRILVPLKDFFGMMHKNKHVQASLELKGPAMSTVALRKFVSIAQEQGVEDQVAVILPPGKRLEHELKDIYANRESKQATQIVRSAVGFSWRTFGQFVNEENSEMMPEDPELLQHLSEFDMWMPPISMLQNIWLTRVAHNADSLKDKSVSPGSRRENMALWIVDDEASARKAIEFGAGSVISNDPLRMRKVLADLIAQYSNSRQCSMLLPSNTQYLPE